MWSCVVDRFDADMRRWVHDRCGLYAALLEALRGSGVCDVTDEEGGHNRDRSHAPSLKGMPPGQVGQGVQRQEARDGPCGPRQRLTAKEDWHGVGSAQDDKGSQNQDRRAAQGNRAVRWLQDSVDRGGTAASSAAAATAANSTSVIDLTTLAAARRSPAGTHMVFTAAGTRPVRPATVTSRPSRWAP
jgi:hypothetical protein